MNIYVSDEIRAKYPGFEFVGHTIKLSDGRLYIRAQHKVLGQTMLYDFESDFFWFSREDIIPLPSLKKDS